MTKLSTFPLILLIFLLASCDAALHMSYSIENKTSETIELFIPSYPIDISVREYSQRVDTVLILQPGQYKVIGFGSKIDFPWGTKNIYRSNPGLCGIKQLAADTTIEFGCTRSEWKYRNRRSILRVK